MLCSVPLGEVWWGARLLAQLVRLWSGTVVVVLTCVWSPVMHACSKLDIRELLYDSKLRGTFYTPWLLFLICRCLNILESQTDLHIYFN